MQFCSIKEQTPQLDRPDICWRDVPEVFVIGSKSPNRHGDQRARVTIIRRLVNLAAEDKNDKKHQEGAPTTTDVIWHPSGSYGYSLEWVAGAIKSKQSEPKDKTKIAAFCSKLQRQI
jgi:hypothetical protein